MKCILKILSITILIIWYLTFGCPFKWITGISCPGCGMTRAFFSLISGDFIAAWNFHPLIYFLPLVIVPLYFKKKLSRKENYIILFIFIFVFTVVYFIRLFGKSDVVCVDSANSVFFRVFEKIKS